MVEETEDLQGTLELLRRYTLLLYVPLHSQDLCVEAAYMYLTRKIVLKSGKEDSIKPIEVTLTVTNDPPLDRQSS